MKLKLKLLRQLRYTLDIVGEPHQAGDIKFRFFFLKFSNKLKFSFIENEYWKSELG